jgi:hypothetical protein
MGQPVVGEVGVVVRAVAGVRVGVHDGRRQPRHGMDETVFGLHGDGMRSQDRQVSRHGDVALSP